MSLQLHLFDFAVEGELGVIDKIVIIWSEGHGFELWKYSCRNAG